MDGWWLPCAWPTLPATVHAVPWNACTPTIAASSEVRTTWPRPVRSRSISAASTPYAPYMPASRSPIGTPTRCGSSGPEPVSDMRPPSPWAIWSYPARPPSGPSWPKPLIARVTRRGFSSARTSVPNPSRASVPGRKFSNSTSARRSSSASTALSASSLRSRVIDSLFLFVDRKYVDSRCPFPGCTNGGPQPRVSSPLPGFSTLITRAPRSPSIIAACGPARARVRSTTSVPESGPRVSSVIVCSSDPAGDHDRRPDEQRSGQRHQDAVGEDLLVVLLLADRVRAVGHHQCPVGGEGAHVDDRRGHREGGNDGDGPDVTGGDQRDRDRHDDRQQSGGRGKGRGDPADVAENEGTDEDGAEARRPRADRLRRPRGVEDRGEAADAGDQQHGRPRDLLDGALLLLREQRGQDDRGGDRGEPDVAVEDERHERDGHEGDQRDDLVGEAPSGEGLVGPRVGRGGPRRREAARARGGAGRRGAGRRGAGRRAASGNPTCHCAAVDVLVRVAG